MEPVLISRECKPRDYSEDYLGKTGTYNSTERLWNTETKKDYYVTTEVNSCTHFLLQAGALIDSWCEGVIFKEAFYAQDGSITVIESEGGPCQPAAPKMKHFANLQRFSKTTGQPVGEPWPNDPNDPHYIAPVSGDGFCD